MQVWDIGSHVSSLSMAANYLQGCDAVLAVYDANRHEVRLVKPLTRLAACDSSRATATWWRKRQGTAGHVELSAVPTHKRQDGILMAKPHGSRWPPTAAAYASELTSCFFAVHMCRLTHRSASGWTSCSRCSKKQQFHTLQ